jgi:thiol-disulfide isomerase/thioredoxin
LPSSGIGLPGAERGTQKDARSTPPPSRTASPSGGVWLVVLCIAAGAAFALLGVPGEEPVGRGSRAPDFSLPRLGGSDPVRLADLRGRVVLVNFWATWCRPCEDEMPAMQRLYETLAGSRFELLAISVDEDPAFPILLDPDQRVARGWQTFRFPETLLIGPDGEVLERYVGPREWDAVAYVERIRRLLQAEVPSGRLGDS